MSNQNQNNGKTPPPVPPKAEEKKVEPPAQPAQVQPAAPVPAASALFSMSKEDLAMVMAMAAQLIQNNQGQRGPLGGDPKQGDAAQRAMMNTRCSTCGQLEVACKRQHVMMIVWPTRYPHLAYDRKGILQFPQMRVNGVPYRSPNGNTPIPVPEVNDLPSWIQSWENEEQALLYGRPKPEAGPGYVQTPKGNVYNFGSLPTSIM